LVLALGLPLQTAAYSIMAHQAIIDVVWESDLKPLLRLKYPKATEEELNDAEAFAYGGSIIQDLGYYPHGSHLFSDLTHYVRSGDFVQSMLKNSQDVYDYAFALGALAHYVTDNDGHPMATNASVPMLYPNLRKKYGDTVTYEQDPLAHVKTEFGFDVLQVARGHYATEDYHDFVGFEVSQPLLEQAFQETYGLPLKSVLPDEERALNSYRYDVSKLIPKATRVAWSLKSKEIEKAQPGATHRKFIYNLKRADFEKQWGKDYQRPTFGDQILAFIYRILPKFGPLKVLQLKVPTPPAETLFEKSFNASVDGFRERLTEVRSGTLNLSNRNLDVGIETPPGEYRLGDKARAELLDALAQEKFQTVTKEIRADLLRFFADPRAAQEFQKKPKEWKKLQAEVADLKAYRIPPQNGENAAQTGVPERRETSVSLR
jgi:hypothetical protein